MINAATIKKSLIATAVAAAVAIASVAVGANALASSGEGDDLPIVGDALATASEVALNHTGGGTVTETEIEDEDSYYEVEVTLTDGTQIDVQLDEQFNVVSSETDDENETGDDD